MNDKKTKLVEIIMNEAKTAPILGVWNEGDGVVGLMVRQDGSFLGVEDYAERAGKLEDLTVKELGAMASVCEQVKDFEFEPDEFSLSFNEVKWLYELKENSGLVINGKVYSFKNDDVGGTYEHSGMRGEDYKEIIQLKCDIQYIDECGVVKIIKAGEDCQAYTYDYGDEVLVYIKDDWSCAVKEMHTIFEKKTQLIKLKC